MLNKWLFKHIDNSALIVFRIIFGLLCFLESVGAILTGWVKMTLIDPKFTFNFFATNIRKWDVLLLRYNEHFCAFYYAGL